MSYVTQSNLNVHKNFKKRHSKKTKVVKPLQTYSVTLAYIDPQPLNEQEEKLIEDIVTVQGVYFKPRRRAVTLIEGEPTEKFSNLQFSTEIEYQGWLDFQRLDNTFYSGYQFIDLLYDGEVIE